MLEWLRRALPIIEWLPEYSPSDARGDVTAGLTVGIMLIPQGMAYAVLAGLPPIYGLYAALIPLLVYPLLGTSRHLAVGVIAIDMVIIAAGLGPLAEPGSPQYVALAILLALMVGLIQIGMAAAKLGFIATLLSRPVISGFTTAAAFIIGFSQLGNLTGLDLPRSEFFYELIWDALQQTGDIHFLSLGLGAAGIAVMAGFKKWVPLFPGSLVVVVGGMLAAWLLDLENQGVELVNSIPQGLPHPEVPALGLENIRELLFTALTLALVQFMSVVSLGRVFGRRHGYTIDPNRELLAFGTANVLGSFFRSIPVSSSFSRSTVNEQAGAQTALANVVAAGMVALTLLFLTPFFYYLPMPALAAIIIVAAANLIDFDELHYLFRVKERDGYVALITFSTTLLIGIQEGILLGIAASTVALLYRVSRPHVAELGHLPGTHSFRNVERFTDAKVIEDILILRIDAAFSFFNASYFKDFILEKSESKNRPIRAVIIDGTSINDLDTTAIESLEEVISTLQKSDIDVYFAGLKGQVRDVLRHSSLPQLLDDEHFQTSPNRAVKHILNKWDIEDKEYRLDRYMELAEKETSKR